MENNFRFYMPLDTLEKSKDEEGKDIYKFKGLASTGSEDSDGEFLEPDGFELDQFKFVNYNHRPEPKYIIGEPTKAVVKNGKFLVEGNLWGDTETGKEVIDLMKTLEKNSKNKTRLGISVEGKALERNPLNNKRVTKAKITSIALCPIPKNSDTWAELIQKGFVNDIEHYEYDIEKASANGGEQYIIDVTDPNTGMRYTVNKDFSIKVEKAINTVDNGQVVKEDLEGKVKPQNDCTEQDIRKSIVILAAAHKIGKISGSIIKRFHNRLKS